MAEKLHILNPETEKLNDRDVLLMLIQENYFQLLKDQKELTAANYKTAMSNQNPQLSPDMDNVFERVEHWHSHRNQTNHLSRKNLYQAPQLNEEPPEQLQQSSEIPKITRGQLTLIK